MLDASGFFSWGNVTNAGRITRTLFETDTGKLLYFSKIRKLWELNLEEAVDIFISHNGKELRRGKKLEEKGEEWEVKLISVRAGMRKKDLRIPGTSAMPGFNLEIFKYPLETFELLGLF